MNPAVSKHYIARVIQLPTIEDLRYVAKDVLRLLRKRCINESSHFDEVEQVIDSPPQKTVTYLQRAYSLYVFFYGLTVLAEYSEVAYKDCGGMVWLVDAFLDHLRNAFQTVITVKASLNAIDISRFVQLAVSEYNSAIDRHGKFRIQRFFLQVPPRPLPSLELNRLSAFPTLIPPPPFHR